MYILIKIKSYRRNRTNYLEICTQTIYLIEIYFKIGTNIFGVFVFFAFIRSSLSKSPYMEMKTDDL